MIAIDTEELIPYVPEQDRGLPAEQRTSFLIKALDVRDEQALNKIREGEESKFLFAFEVLRRGIRGWFNFPDRKGIPVEYQGDSDGKPTDWSLSRIPIRVRSELVFAILDTSRLSEEEVKKPG